MNISFEKVRHNLCQVSLSIPYSYSDLKKEFERESWIDHGNITERAGDPHLNRSCLPSPSSPILKDILNQLSSNETKHQVIDTMYDFFPSIQENWDGWSKKQMFDKTLWGGQFLKDKPGYYIKPHIDTRIQIITCLIYFIADHDPNQTTIFYTDSNLSDPWMAPTGAGCGVMHVNDYDVWHEGGNNSNTDRYLAILGLIINI